MSAAALSLGGLLQNRTVRSIYVPADGLSRGGDIGLLAFFLLLVIALSSWWLALHYRGASDFTDTHGYMAQAKYLSHERQFNPARITWEDYASGEGNLNAMMHYPGQLFSLTIGRIAKVLHRPLDMKMIVAFNFCVYVFTSVFCLLFLTRHLRGWEFFLIGFFSLTNYFVMATPVSTLTDGLGFAFFVFALWLSSLKRKRYFIIGTVFGLSFFVRAHLAIYALFFPLLLCERFNKRAIRYTLLYVLGIVCAYGSLLGGLKLYVKSPDPPVTVAQYAHTQGLHFTLPEDQQDVHQQKTTNVNDNLSTFGWYRRQIFASLPTLKEYGIGWVTLGAYQTLGPASWWCGPLFMVVALALLFRWTTPTITRYSLYVVCTLVTFYCAAYVLLQPGPVTKMIGELTTLGRYFCYFFPLLPLVFWLILRERLLPDMQFIPFLEKIKQKVFGQTLDARLVLTGIVLCLVFPSCFSYWGYGAALLAKMPVRQGTVVFRGDDILRQELSVFPPDAMVLSSRYFAVHVFSSVKHVVQCPASVDDFLQNKNNHLLDALVMFPRDLHATVKMTDSEQQRWWDELSKDIIVDEQGNRFVKVCSHNGEGGDADTRNRRTFVLYRRVGSPGSNLETL